MNYLPTDYQSFIHYVYFHVDPSNGKVFYIGHGCRGRAWIHGSRRTCLRSQDHLDKLENLISQGFLPEDWVFIHKKGLDKRTACLEEQKLIRDLQPEFNLPQGKHLLKINPETLKICRILRNEGLFYNQIADEVGVSTMTVYRALNGQTKNIGEDFE